jgi:hypothetical protein
MICSLNSLTRASSPNGSPEGSSTFFGTPWSSVHPLARLALHAYSS